MSELRWNPLLKSWTIVASDRQNRPQMPKDYCPFCPGSGKVPDEYDVLAYDNDFPALSPEPSEPDPVDSGFYKTEKSYGKCEVLLYSSEHKKSFFELSLEQIRKVIDLWVSRFEELSKDRKLHYIFIFENKGEEVGVTMPHPHGQIYAYPYIPQKIKVEIDSCKEYYDSNSKCMICQMNIEETEFKKRIIFENSDFLAYLPFFTDYPYGVFIVSKSHKGTIEEFNDNEKNSLAEILKVVTGSFEKLFDVPFPYMMVMHQNPVTSRDYKDVENYYHFHIEFYPPLRDKNKIKYYASTEMGAWTPANVAAVEETAAQLRKAKLKYLSKWNSALLRREIIHEFVSVFGGKEVDISVYSAPARANLIGEHIDYNGGSVLPVALDLYTYMVIRKRKDGEVIIRDTNYPEVVQTGINDDWQKNGVPWANYLKGVMKVLRDKGYKIDTGFEVLFFSDIPVASGLSSSAAFEVVFAYGLSDVYNLGISKENIALLCQKAENDFVGVHCGIMDQFSVAMAEKDKAILLDCETLKHEMIPLKLGNYKIVIANSNKKRKLIDSQYNIRQKECEEGLKEVQKEYKVKSLCGINVEQFDRIKAKIMNTTIRKRVRHVVTENGRVAAAAESLKNGNLKEFGKLMEKSHLSLRDDYEVTGIELDTLFEEARRFKGCIGTRMTGAGFGGCTISIVKQDKIEDFIAAVANTYFAETGIQPAFFVCDTGDGVKKV